MGGVGTRLSFIRHGRLAAAAGMLGLALPGCSSTPSLSSMFGSSTATTQAGASADALLPPNFECPNVTVRQGASTLASSANPNDQSALNMRYQVGIGQTARECKLVGGTVTMRVGIEGRVVLGPAGGPGQIDVPVRLAVVHESTSPKPIVSKLQKVTVTIPPDSTNVTFTLVEDDLSFPMPKGGDIDSYVVYVGFDPLGAQELDRRKKPAPKPPARPRRTT